MNSDYVDESGKIKCYVCRSNKSAVEASICQGCMKFVCDPKCGAHVPRLGGWFCKDCQKKTERISKN